MAITLPEGLAFGGMGISENFITGLIIAAQLAVVLTIVIIVLWFFLRYYKYNTNVIIFSKRGDKGKILTDKGGYFQDKKDKTWVFKLLKHKIGIKPPLYEYLIPAAKGNTLFLFQQDIDKFYPVKANIAGTGNPEYSMALKTQDYDIDLWSATEMIRTRQQFQKQSFLEKYANYIFIGVFAMLMVIMFYIILQGMADVTAGINGAVAKLASAQQAPTPPPAW